MQKEQGKGNIAMHLRHGSMGRAHSRRWLLVILGVWALANASVHGEGLLEWTQQTKLVDPVPVAGDRFGGSVGISGDTAVVGAYEQGAGEAAVFTRSADAWSRQTTLTASDGAAGDRFGWSVAVSGETAVVGAYADADAGSQSGSAYVFVRSGTSWFQQAKLTASDAASLAQFGVSVAISSDTIVVGAPGTDGRGAAYVFVRAGGNWTEQAKLTSIEGNSGDQFGCAVALARDTVLVGSRFDGDLGAAYVFTRSGGLWTQQARLTAGDGVSGERFGGAVALSATGQSALIGAQFGYDGAAQPGSAYLFSNSGGAWTQQAKLTASDGADNDYFGVSVAVADDTAIVAAHEHDALADNAGAVYVFERTESGWGQQNKLTSADARPGDRLGNAIALSSGTLIVGAQYADSLVTDSGAAYVFVDAFHWTPQDKVTGSDTNAADRLGGSVAIDGDLAVAGAYDHAAGSAYVFQRSGDVWDEVAKLTASDGEGGDRLGWSVSISKSTVVAGAYADSDDGLQSGAAYVFAHDGTGWSEQEKLKASDAAALGKFGNAVAISSDTIVVGAPGADDRGAAYVFTRNGTVWTEQAKLSASDGVSGDQFGCSVAVAGDTAVVGARLHATTGVAYVFRRSGNVWTEEATLAPQGSSLGERFAGAVAISPSARTVIAGAQLGYNGSVRTGAGYVYAWNGTNWSQQAKLLASDGVLNDYLGVSVGISDDTAVIAAHEKDDPANSGAVYVFSRSGDVWQEHAMLRADDANDGDRFGNALGLSEDTVVVGMQNSDAAGIDSGAVYFFVRSHNRAPGQPTNLAPPDAATSISLTPTLTSTAFSDPDTGDSHAASQWQVRAASSPADYSLVAYDSGESDIDLLDTTVPDGALNYSTVYAWRVRHRDHHGTWGAWAVETYFTTLTGGVTNAAPEKPSNRSPSSSQGGLSITPLLEGSEFVDHDAGDYHAATRFRIRSATGSYSPALHDSQPTSQGVTRYRVPSGVLVYGSTYYWQLRYGDSRGAWSEWSDETAFSTAGDGGTPAPEGLRAAAGAQSVWLTWVLQSDPLVLGYNVYRAVSATGPWLTPVNSEPVRGSEYMDADLTPGTTYYYRLSTVSQSGESELTAAVPAIVGATRIFMTPMRGEPGDLISQMLTIDNPNDIGNQGLQIEVIYDATMITPLDLRKTALTEDFTLGHNLGTADGHIIIAGTGSSAAIRGEGHILELLYRVDTAADYWDASDLWFDYVELVDDAVPPHNLDIDYTSTASMTVAGRLLLGDLDSNGRVSIYDEVLLQMIVLGQLTPSSYQEMAGDLNGDGQLDSADLVLIRRIIMTGGASIAGSQIDAAGHSQAKGNTYQQGWGAQASRPLTIEVPVTLSDCLDVAGMDLVVNFNPEHLTFEGASPSQERLAFESWQTFESNGQLHIVAANPSASGAGSGTVARLRFGVRGHWVTTPLRVAKFKLSDAEGRNLDRLNTVRIDDTLLTYIGPAGTGPGWPLY